MYSIFVYGSLAPNKPNAHILEKLNGTWEEGFVYGKLVSSGWGADIGFPGIVLDDNGDKISGFIFYSDNLPNYWVQLDEFEGADYIRQPVKVITKSGNIVNSFIYALNPTN